MRSEQTQHRRRPHCCVPARLETGSRREAKVKKSTNDRVANPKRVPNPRWETDSLPCPPPRGSTQPSRSSFSLYPNKAKNLLLLFESVAENGGGGSRERGGFVPGKRDQKPLPSHVKPLEAGQNLFPKPECLSTASNEQRSSRERLFGSKCKSFKFLSQGRDKYLCQLNKRAGDIIYEGVWGTKQPKRRAAIYLSADGGIKRTASQLGDGGVPS